MKPILAIAAVLTVTVATGIPSAAGSWPRSQDDRGFSITLVSPTDIYLTGKMTMRIEAIIPRGDSIEQVDFFVDGRLAFIDVREPYSHEVDFGDDIRRHAIEVRALTHQGRRAKVSIVSRSADLSEGAKGRVETLSVMVRNAAGHPVEGLSVGDFLLRENGARQPIVHFEGGGSPSSLALILLPGDPVPAPDVIDHLASFLRGLPHHHAALVVGDAAPKEKAEAAPEKPGAAFSYDLESVAAGLLARGEPPSLPADALPARLLAGAEALGSRRGARVLFILAADAIIASAEPAPADPAAAAPPKPEAKAPHATEPPEPGPLERALQAARQAGAVLYCVALGPDPGVRPEGPIEKAVADSGGRFLPAAGLPELEQALATVDEALRHRYLISYMPADPDRPGLRPVEVTVLVDGLSIEAPRSLAFP